MKLPFCVSRTVIAAATLFTTNAAVAAPTPIDLGTWVVEDYVSLDGPANWAISGLGNSIAFQSNNSDPSILRSNGAIDVAGLQIRGTWRVETNADDDYIGFVFGYQNRGQMYVFDWKKATQGTLDVGMNIKRIDTGGAADPSRDDFATTAGTATTTILRQNDVPWESFVDYEFLLIFGVGLFEIQVTQGATVLQNWIVTDNTFTSGDFGFYNLSQSGVRYLGFTQDDVPTLMIDKTATPMTYSAVGNVISYSYLVTNTSNVTVNGPFTVDDDKSTDESCPVGDLAPGEFLTCTSTYTITQADLEGGSVINVATAAGQVDARPVISPPDTVTVNFAALPPRPPAPVPAMSEWMMALMAALLVLVGVVTLRRLG